MNHKYNKRQVSYSESFVFRSRCPHCGSNINNKCLFADLTGALLIHNFDQFKKRIIGKQPVNIGSSCFYISSKKLKRKVLKKGIIRYYGNFSPTIFAKIADNSVSKMIICSYCRATRWYFKGNSHKRALKSIKV